jgi:Alcohol dehydrogenase GroES-associated
MKAVVFHNVGDIRVEEVPEPKLQAPTLPRRVLRAVR